MASVPEGFELVDENIPEGFELVESEGLGIGEALAGVANLAAAVPVELGRLGVQGISTVGGLINPFIPQEQAVEAGKALAEEIPSVPIGESAQKLISTLGKGFDLLPESVQGFIKEATQPLGPSIGQSAFEATRKIPVVGETIAPAVGAAVGAIPGALEAATLVRPARAVGAAVGRASDVFTRQSPAKQKIAELIASGSTDVDTAKFRLDGTKVRKDKKAVEAIKQGFDEGVIAAVKGSKPQDKVAFKKMVNIMEKGKNNARFAATNRPSDVLGSSLMDRVRIIQNANTTAGKQLDSVARGLKGKSVDVAPAVDNFVSDLRDMGIKIDDNLKVDFKGSDIEGLSGPESVINRIVKRMAGTRTPDAFEAHRLKRFIDEQVTFGKNAEGLAGQTERVLKNLRRNIDQTLDLNFPEYDRVNTAYSETIGALDALQDVAGKRMNLTGVNADKATGTLMRRVLSNSQSRVNLLDSVEEIERVAKKFGPGKIDNDLLSQVLFVDELDSVFGPVARTSFQGQIQQAVQKGAAASVSPLTAGAELIGRGAERLRGINEQGAFKAIRKLLNE